MKDLFSSALLFGNVLFFALPLFAQEEDQKTFVELSQQVINPTSGKGAIPLNFRVGYVWFGKLKYNAYIEPEFMAIRSDGYARNRTDLGIRFGFRWYLPM
jgi:hypothetical protein